MNKRRHHGHTRNTVSRRVSVRWPRGRCKNEGEKRHLDDEVLGHHDDQGGHGRGHKNAHAAQYHHGLDVCVAENAQEICEAADDNEDKERRDVGGW